MSGSASRLAESLQVRSLSHHLVQADGPDPHRARARAILKAHPEVKDLFGPDQRSFLAIIGVVALQLVVAAATKDSSFWLILLLSYTVGATANHALFVMIHECSHLLIFRRSWANQACSILANLPVFFATGISFRIYHPIHHQSLGDPLLDPDSPTSWELKFAGSGILWRKWIWIAFLSYFQLLRGIRADRGYSQGEALNFVVVAAVWIALIAYTGSWNPFWYLLLSTHWSTGFHPLGARWIQEHHRLDGDSMQETFSYYGPLNRLSFNVGYHTEHHDFPSIPWTKLPRLRQIAPEFYTEGRASYSSWTGLFRRYLFDSRVTLSHRVVRLPQ